MEKFLTGLETHVSFKNSQGAEGRGTLIHITRTNLIFEVYNPYSIVQVSEMLQDLQVLRGERVVYRGRAVISNIVATGLMHIVSASLMDVWMDLTAPTPGVQLREEVRNFVEEWQASHLLSPSYRLAINDLRNFFSELSRWLGQLEAAVGIDQLEQRPTLQREFCEDIEAPLLPKLTEMGIKLEEEGKRIMPEDEPIHKAYARRELHPLIMRAPFCHRCFIKPLGYAGDYEMVNMILRDRWEGPNTYAKIVNSMLLRSGTAEAHRNRVVVLRRILVEEATRAAAEGRKLKVLNIGCGPAAEVQAFVREDAVSAHVEFELVDFNDETLAYTKRRIEEAQTRSGREVPFTFTHRSIHELLKMSSGRKEPILPEYDLVYCAGLFDYLSDTICRRLLKLFFDWTIPGGKVVATNVHTRHPVRIFLEHLLDWYLILRNENDMLEISPKGGETTLELEPSGVNVFVHIRKPAIHKG